jgi:hypothetical protein
MQIRALFVATLAVMISASMPHAEPVDPAQAIAQKFSEASDEKPAPTAAPEESNADYEADMLRRARAEELDRQKQEAQQAPAKPAAPLALPAATPVAQTPTTPVLPLTPAPAVQTPPSAPAAVAALPPKSTPQQPTVSPQPPTEPAPVLTPAPAAQTSLPATSVAALPPKLAPQQPITYPEPQGPGPATPATVLLVLDTDGGTLGFKPDPIICIDESCWLSNGIQAHAVSMPRTQAVALQTTDESTADSCGGKSACVYRGVMIYPTARIEVIEVGEGHGASAGAYTVATDTSCRKENGVLLCDNGLATQNFRIWVVPEAIAESAGNSSLEDAVADGLPDSDIAPGNDK